tara:strand:- start:457 stop:1542 length:1086 start_codon:yes stop_codon:yes gene_type:complete
MDKRVDNFCAGPCTLPFSVLEDVRDELINFANTGMSIIEDSHRSPSYDAIHHETLNLFRNLANVPEDFAVLFLQGGATLQFAQVPLNLLSENQKSGYINTGSWADKALTDAKKIANTYEAWSGLQEGFIRTPNCNEITIQPNTRYIHMTSNETINGIRFPTYPDVDIPLVADMSSDLLSRPIDWSRFDLIYGGIQKNLGPAGVTVVVVRRSRLGTHGRNLPSYLDYQTHDDAHSLMNTPPMFSIYVMNKVLNWMAEVGGVQEFETRATKRSALIYETIDQSNEWYRSPVDKKCRSHMNVIFHLPSKVLEKKFIDQAIELGMVNLKGHRNVGGIRASIYNAMQIESVERLAEFMNAYKKSNS